MAGDSKLGAKYALLNPYLNERQRRLVAAADARMLGHGGIAAVARAAEMSRTTLHKAVRDVMESLKIEKAEFHGEWNYRILPQ